MIYDSSYVPRQLSQEPNLYVKAVPDRGRGVFSTIPLWKGHVIEICPVILMEEEASQCNLKNYYWNWPDKNSPGMVYALPFGYGPLYNHSFEPNARFYRNYEHRVITFVAIKNIPANTEILCNYNGNPQSTAPVAFDVV